VEARVQRIELEKLRSELRIARRMLAQAWGGEEARFERAVGRLDTLRTIPSLDLLIARLEESPVQARWAAEIAGREASARLEDARGSLDLSLGAGVRYHGDSDDGSFTFRVGLPLPINDRNQGSREAARLRVLGAQEERMRNETLSRIALANALDDALASAEEARAIGESVQPDAERVFSGSREMYERGLLRLTDVLDSERSLFELRSRRLDALARYHETLAELERLTGEPLAGGQD
jgi:cobalt-zinc-cadmium efflux system outer membrane protein